MAYMDTYNEIWENGAEMVMPAIEPADPVSSVDFAPETLEGAEVSRELGDTQIGHQIQTVGAILQADMGAPQMQVAVAPEIDDSLGLSAIGNVGHEVTEEIHAQLDQAPPPQPQPFQL